MSGFKSYTLLCPLRNVHHSIQEIGQWVAKLISGHWYNVDVGKNPMYKTGRTRILETIHIFATYFIQCENSNLWCWAFKNKTPRNILLTLYWSWLYRRFYVFAKRRQYNSLKPLTLLKCKLSLTTDQQIQISPKLPKRYQSDYRWHWHDEIIHKLMCRWCVLGIIVKR